LLSTKKTLLTIFAMPNESEETLFSPERLAELIEAASESTDDWKFEELGTVWSHQLDAPLEYELGGLSADVEDLMAFRTFRTLLHDAKPPLDLLALVKFYAKTHGQSKDGLLPREIANALYFTTLAAGIVCHGRILGPLTPQAVEKGLRWCSQQPWLDGESRSLMAKTLVRLCAPL
jgi:hypothetical protein